MNLNIVKEIENQLIGRKELKLVAEHPNSPTPSRKDLLKTIAAKLGKDEKLLVIRKIKSCFGKPVSYIYVHLYNDPKDVFKWEPKYVLERNGLIGGKE